MQDVTMLRTTLKEVLVKMKSETTNDAAVRRKALEQGRLQIENEMTRFHQVLKQSKEHVEVMRVDVVERRAQPSAAYVQSIRDMMQNS